MFEAIASLPPVPVFAWVTAVLCAAVPAGVAFWPRAKRSWHRRRQERNRLVALEAPRSFDSLDDDEPEPLDLPQLAREVVYGALVGGGSIWLAGSWFENWVSYALIGVGILGALTALWRRLNNPPAEPEDGEGFLATSEVPREATLGFLAALAIVFGLLAVLMLLV